MLEGSGKQLLGEKPVDAVLWTFPSRLERYKIEVLCVAAFLGGVK